MRSSDRNSDSPWNRLPWTLPTALLIWTVSLWIMAFFMGKPSHRPTEPPPIDAQFIEQFIPYAAEDIGPGRAGASEAQPQAEQQPAPKEVKPETGITKPRPKPVRKPPNHVAVAKPSTDETAPAPGIASEQQDGAEREQFASIGAQGGSPYGKGTSTGSMYANSGARAILQPLPQIPDDLRREAFNSSVLARFHIAPDGSAEVELARPTQDVRLNRLVMDSLKKWRFMPAIKNGKPVASVEEILVKIEVK